MIGFIMPVAEKEFVLNYTMNRWQLNFKRNVGPTSSSIRKCNPSSIDEWKNFYYENIKSKEHIDNLGNKLFFHIKETLPNEKRFHPDLLEIVDIDDCKKYMHDLVITRTYNGFEKERGRK
jgi:hypothetical protein